MIRLIVYGARGRMGTRVCTLAHGDQRFDVVAMFGRDDIPDRAECEPDAIIDFSSPQGAEAAGRVGR